MFNNDPAVQKRKQSIIDVGQRTQLDLANGEVRRNKLILTNLRLETKQLKLALQQASRGKRNTGGVAHSQSEEETLHNKICLLKRSLNSVKGKKEELMREIERTIEETNFTMAEECSTLDKDSAVAQKIRALENRLDKCLIKHNEVNTIRQTYESLLERLQQEQAGFDTQLAAMEKTLQNKERDLVDLNSVASDAAKGRDAAKSEVARLKTQIAKERREQRKDIDDRKAFLESKRKHLERTQKQLMEKMERDDERRMRSRQHPANAQGRKRAAMLRNQTASQQLTEEELQQQAEQREAYNHLKDLTSASNVRDVIAKLAERQDAHAQLQRTLEKAERSHAALQAERARLLEQWDAMQQANGGLAKPGDAGSSAGELSTDQSGGGGGDGGGGAEESAAGRRALVRRRVLEDFDAHLRARQHELDAAQEAQEALGRQLTDVDAGVQHLAEKCAAAVDAGSAEESPTPTPRPGRFDAPPAARGRAIVDLLRTCQARLLRLREDITEEDVLAAARTVEKWNGTMPEANVRVRVEQRGTQDAGAFNELNRESESDSDHADDGDPAGVKKRWFGKDAATTDSHAEDFPENEIHDRHELKLMSIATVERERKKAKKLLQRRSKEEGM